MSGAKHTPGPWFINHAGSGRDGKLIYDEIYIYAPSCGVEDVAVASDIADPLGKDDGMANALLIAAAPELLTWLKWSTKYLSNEAKQSGQYTMLLAAIAKAEGGAK